MKQENVALNNIPVGALGLIPMPGTEDLGQKVNNHLVKWRNEEENDDYNHSFVGYHRDNYILKVSTPRFGSGEGKGILQESARGYDIFLLCDVTNHSLTYKMCGQENHMSPDDHFQNLKRIIAALGGKAHRITVIMPFLYEGRQHKRTTRESLDCALALQELVSMGVENIITFDAHDPRVQNAIPLMGFDNVMPTYQVLKAILKNVKDVTFTKDKFMIVSPDEGALNRNMYYASVLGVDMGMFYKRRDYSQIVNGRNPIVAHEYLGNPVDGKDIFVADDIISSGESMLDLAYNLKNRNAGRIFTYATYTIFTNGLEKFDKAFEDGIIDGVFGTNLTYRSPELLSRPWFHEVDVSKYISYFIEAINHEVSISKILDPHEKIEALLKKYGMK